MEALFQSSKNDQVLSFRQCSEEEEKWNDSAEADHSAWSRTFKIYRSAQICGESAMQGAPVLGKRRLRQRADNSMSMGKKRNTTWHSIQLDGTRLNKLSITGQEIHA